MIIAKVAGLARKASEVAMPKQVLIQYMKIFLKLSEILFNMMSMTKTLGWRHLLRTSL